MLRKQNKNKQNMKFYSASAISSYYTHVFFLMLVPKKPGFH